MLTAHSFEQAANSEARAGIAPAYVGFADRCVTPSPPSQCAYTSTHHQATKALRAELIKPLAALLTFVNDKVKKGEAT